VGARLLSAPSFGRGRSRRFAVTLGLVLFDLGPTTFQQPYVPAGTIDFPEHRDDGELKDFRNFHTLKDRNAHDTMGMSQLVMQTPSARAPHPGDLLVQTHFVEPLEESLARVLPDSIQDIDWNQLSLFRTGLNMLNIHDLYLNGPHMTRLPWRSPVLVSARTVSLPEGERLTREAIPSEGNVSESKA
jgi:hypothetical protein